MHAASTAGGELRIRVVRHERLLHVLSRTIHQAQLQRLTWSHACERVLYSTAGGGGAAHRGSQAYGAKSMY